MRSLSHYEKYGKKSYEKNKEKYLKQRRDKYAEDVSLRERKAEYYLEVEKASRSKVARATTRADNLRRRRYGVEPEEYSRMLVEQDFRCGICRIKFTGTPDIDHCHTTKKVRGLLCNNCNRGLGHFQDNPDFLKEAIQWLK